MQWPAHRVDRLRVVALSSDRITTLDSGLTVATDRVPQARSVAIGVWVGVGSRDEPAALAGVSHFLEHLLFKGTDRRSAIDISRSIDRVGGDLNAFTSKEYTAFYCRVPRRHQDAGVELLGDVLTSPRLDPDDVERERLVILEELAMDDDSPEDVAHREFFRHVLADHPLGWDTAGDRATVQAISADDIRSFFAERYVTGNTVVAVAGDVDHDVVTAAVDRAFAPMVQSRCADSRVGPAPGWAPGEGGDLVTMQTDHEQFQLVTGTRGMSVHDPRKPAADVANHVLGGGLSSRLFDEVRERRGLAYSVYSTAASFADCGVWSIHVGTSPEHLDEVRRVVDHEVERFAFDGITEDERDVAVGALVGSYEIGLEDTGARMARMGELLVTGRQVLPVDQHLAHWEAVSVADVAAVTADVYATPRLTVSVGPSAKL